MYFLPIIQLVKNFCYGQKVVSLGLSSDKAFSLMIDEQIDNDEAHDG